MRIESPQSPPGAAVPPPSAAPGGPHPAQREVAEAIAAAILDIAAQHPCWGGTGSHWADCWMAHPECALAHAAEVARRFGVQS